MHAISLSIAELYSFKLLAPLETCKKVGELLRNDSFTRPDGFRSVSHTLPLSLR